MQYSLSHFLHLKNKQTCIHYKFQIANGPLSNFL